MSSNNSKIIVGASGAATAYVGDDLNNKGFFATGTALAAAFPAGVDGWYAVVGATDTIWVWDSPTSAWVDSGNRFTAGGMLIATYDPTNVAADVFDVDNHVSGTTNKVYTAIEKTKLAGIASGAQVNVKPDWNAASGNVAEILNKPTIPATTNDITSQPNKRYVTDANLSDLAGISSTLTALFRSSKLETATGSAGQVISFSAAFTANYVLLFQDPNGVGIEVTAQDANGFTITPVSAGDFGYLAIKIQ